MLKFAKLGSIALVCIPFAACSTPFGQHFASGLDSAVGTILGDLNTATTLVNADVAGANKWIATHQTSVADLCSRIGTAQGYYNAFNVQGMLTLNEQKAASIASNVAAATCSAPPSDIPTALATLAKSWAVIQAASATK